MKILLISTAHNSLSQRLHLDLSPYHEVTIEYALSAHIMIEAVELSKPHLIVCPFLTVMVPKEVYEQYLTLVVHPGPPGDAGPSSLDWVLMGDDGTNADAESLLKKDASSAKGRSHWGVTVLQAIEEFDAGPVWAFEQFPINIDDQKVSKSSLYQGDITRAAMSACATAIGRIQAAAGRTAAPEADENARDALVGPHLKASPEYRTVSVTTHEPFQGGLTRALPLLKATQRDFDIKRHPAQIVSRRIRASDSQPGCLSTLFTPNLYLYGGIIEDGEHMATIATEPGTIIGTRNDAVCIKTVDGKGIWITHARRVKKKTDPALWPKSTAVPLLLELGILNARNLPQLLPSLQEDFSEATHSTFQEVYITYETLLNIHRVAYLTFGFYNGAMSTTQCYQTSAALRSILATHTKSSPLSAVVLLGGRRYFSNGIHLNVIEAADDPALESWVNINAINDVVLLLLDDFAAKGITTISAIRGNAAAGGVALAAAADLVIAGENVVLNPAYRTLGLYGSEYHTISYYGRTGQETATHLLRDMLPISTQEAKKIGLVDVVLPGYGEALDRAVREYTGTVISLGDKVGQWKEKLDISAPTIARARMQELGEMCKDFWSGRSIRYHSRRYNFVRKVKATKTPLRFAQHRRGSGDMDEEEGDAFDLVHTFAPAGVQTKRNVLAQSVKQSKLMALQLTEPTPALLNEKNLETVFSCYYNSQAT